MIAASHLRRPESPCSILLSTLIRNADISMTLPRLGGTVCGLRCTLSGSFGIVYCCQDDVILVILVQTFYKKNNSYQKSFCSESDDTVAYDSDTELDKNSSGL